METMGHWHVKNSGHSELGSFTLPAQGPSELSLLHSRLRCRDVGKHKLEQNLVGLWAIHHLRIAEHGALQPPPPMPMAEVGGVQGSFAAPSYCCIPFALQEPMRMGMGLVMESGSDPTTQRGLSLPRFVRLDGEEPGRFQNAHSCLVTTAQGEGAGQNQLLQQGCGQAQCHLPPCHPAWCRGRARGQGLVFPVPHSERMPPQWALGGSSPCMRHKEGRYLFPPSQLCICPGTSDNGAQPEQKAPGQANSLWCSSEHRAGALWAPSTWQ